MTQELHVVLGRGALRRLEDWLCSPINAPGKHKVVRQVRAALAQHFKCLNNAHGILARSESANE